MKLLLFIILITITGCARYQWVATETKITINGDRIHFQQLKRPKALSDTTITGMMISRKRIN